MITNILQIIKAATSLPVHPLENENIGEQIIYTITPISDDGVVKQDRLELNIVADSMAKAEQYDTAIRQATLNIGDTCPISGINSISVNGGGTLNSDAGVHRIIYLIITY